MLKTGAPPPPPSNEVRRQRGRVPQRGGLVPGGWAEARPAPPPPPPLGRAPRRGVAISGGCLPRGGRGSSPALARRRPGEPRGISRQAAVACASGGRWPSAAAGRAEVAGAVGRGGASLWPPLGGEGGGPGPQAPLLAPLLPRAPCPQHPPPQTPLAPPSRFCRDPPWRRARNAAQKAGCTLRKEESHVFKRGDRPLGAVNVPALACLRLHAQIVSSMAREATAA